MKILNSVKEIYFVGIGGIGMSALAQILCRRGYKVYGSDLNNTALINKLRQMGVEVSIGHGKKCPDSIGLAVYSSCIDADNPEIIAMRNRGVKLVSRGCLLAELLNEKTGIAIAGTHGKTTTTALIAHVLKACLLDPTVAVGAEVSSLGGNAAVGKSDLFVAEADESDGSFLKLRPFYGVITNIEEEHLDYYESLDNILKSYKLFAEKMKSKGCLVACGDDRNVKIILEKFAKSFITYGFSKECDYRAVNVRTRGLLAEFDCLEKGNYLETFTVNIPGKHNISNALAAISICRLLGIKPADIRATLKTYKGSSRRFEIKSRAGGIIVVEDYAHHPTEIKATLEAARSLKPRRIIVAFQPHRYSRSKHLKDAFVNSFSGADYLIITDIYPASEKPERGIDSRTFYSAVESSRKQTCFLPLGSIAGHVADISCKGDLIIIMGAGDIGGISNEVASKIKK